jgi:hypothetical protein
MGFFIDGLFSTGKARQRREFLLLDRKVAEEISTFKR